MSSTTVEIECVSSAQLHDFSARLREAGYNSLIIDDKIILEVSRTLRMADFENCSSGNILRTMRELMKEKAIFAPNAVVMVNDRTLRGNTMRHAAEVGEIGGVKCGHLFATKIITL